MNPDEYRDGNAESMQMMFLKISHLYFKKMLNQLSDTGVHPGQMPMIKLLGESGGLSQREIAECLQIKPSTVNVSIKRMEKAGLVERRTDEVNKRIIKVYLSRIGESFYRKMNTLVKENEKALFKGFSESEICLMSRFFQQIIENLDTIPSDNMEREMRHHHNHYRKQDMGKEIK